MTYSLDLYEITDGLIGRVPQLKNITYISFLPMDGGFHKILLRLSHPEQLKSMTISGVGENKNLSVLKRFVNLETLYFASDSGVTNEGLQHLRDLHITHLGLTENKGVTDKGVKSIIKIKTLEGIGLRGTGLTTQGVQQIKTAFPEAEIH